MVQVLKPPTPLPNLRAAVSLFLGGTIDMGGSVDWQQVLSQKLIDSFPQSDLLLLNPRRAAWDASWPQDPEFAPFREQVEWELQAQEQASLRVYYFAPKSQSPITLLELGRFATTAQTLVYCPPTFWRAGNVHIFCNRYQVPLFAEEAAFHQAVISAISVKLNV